MLNLHSLFNSSVETSSYLAHLELPVEWRAFIAEAKTAIRACLREGIPRVLREEGYVAGIPAPRFFTQGSWAYKTLNSPAHRTQQADVDDGTYLPLSFVSQTARPSVASTVFFAAAEKALEPLVKARKWRLIVDRATCIRVEIAPFAHIDIPLYAIPDVEFDTLSRAAQAKYGHLGIEEALRKSDRDAWTALPRHAVLLAHREKDWVESDPRQVREWFLREVDVRGEQARRVVRYLKGFRDWQWECDGPSSILLMAASIPLFEQRERRDDLALLHVVEALPAALRGGVCNPVNAKESLTERLGAEGVEDAATKMETFGKHLQGAVYGSNASQACTWLIQQLGPRFPDEPGRAVVASVAATVAATPAVQASSPLVGRTKAG